MFPIFAISRALSSRYVAMRVIQFFSHKCYSFMSFDFLLRRVVISRGGHHLLPVMYAELVMVFSFIFFPFSILCIMRVTRWRQSGYTLTVLEYCTLLMWIRRMLELDFYISLIKSFLISSYASIDFGEGGNVW